MPSFSTIRAIVFIWIQREWQCSLDFQEQDGRGGGRVRAMRPELPWKYRHLWVSCYNGNNDQSVRVLFVQHPREQGEWLRQNPRYARDCIIRPAPTGVDEQYPRSLVIIP